MAVRAIRIRKIQSFGFVKESILALMESIITIEVGPAVFMTFILDNRMQKVKKGVNSSLFGPNLYHLYEN